MDITQRRSPVEENPVLGEQLEDEHADGIRRNSRGRSYDLRRKIKRKRHWSEKSSESKPPRFSSSHTNPSENHNDSLFDTSQSIQPEEEEEDSPNEYEIDDVSIERSRSPEKKERNVSDLMKTRCFDKKSGALLSKEECIKNLREAMKTKRKPDFYEILKLRNSCEPGSVLEELVLHTSFTLFTMGRAQRDRENGGDSSRNNPFESFNIPNAKNNDEVVMMPGGQQILLSSLLKPSMCSRFTGRNAIEKAVLAISGEIQKWDKWFMVYSVPKSCRISKYPLISQEFFDTFASMLKRGFDLSDKAMSTTKLVNLIKETMTGLIARVRAKNKEIAAELLDEFFRMTNQRPEEMDEYFVEQEMCPEESIQMEQEKSLPKEEDGIQVKSECISE
uniref:SPK domain-containing protein n=1 Tax=Caenorhabditis tropicalis TaxID=1561998 RepID=A0A1I7UNW3_9PELO